MPRLLLLLVLFLAKVMQFCSHLYGTVIAVQATALDTSTASDPTLLFPEFIVVAAAAAIPEILVAAITEGKATILFPGGG